MALDPPLESRRPIPHDAGRRRLIAIAKLAAPGIGILIILALLALPLLGSDPLEKSHTAERAKEQLDVSAGMVGPSFQGMDGQGRPFQVRARTADFASDDQRFVRLEQPEGDLALSDGTVVALTAAHGLYDRDDQLMQLQGDVVLFHDDGFEVVTERALLDLPHGRAEGNAPVEGQGPVGHIRSEGFRIEENGAKVVFTGHSRLVLYENAEQGRLP